MSLRDLDRKRECMVGLILIQIFRCIHLVDITLAWPSNWIISYLSHGLRCKKFNALYIVTMYVPCPLLMIHPNVTKFTLSSLHWPRPISIVVIPHHTHRDRRKATDLAEDVFQWRFNENHCILCTITLKFKFVIRDPTDNESALGDGSIPEKHRSRLK